MTEKTAIWNKVIIDVLPDFENIVKTMNDENRKENEFRKLWIKGIPEKLRAKVWTRVTGNNNSITQSLFEIMVSRGMKFRIILQEKTHASSELEQISYEVEQLAKKVEDYKANEKTQTEEKNIDKEKGLNDYETTVKKLNDLTKQKEELDIKHQSLSRDLKLIMGDLKNSKEESIRIIANDIPRTFSSEHVFKSELYADTLQKVLEAFSVYRPDIGYVQGMSYICGIICLLTKTDYACFILFHNIITKSNLFPFYSFDDTYMKQRIVIFKQIFGYNLQDLCFHFEDEGIQPNLYLYEWFMSLFAKALNMDIVCRVWDLILLDGIPILYKTAIVILSSLEEELLNSDFDDIMRILRNTSNSIKNEDEFIDQIMKITLPRWIDLELPILEQDKLPDELM
jgi:hypothetical protein